MGFVMGLFLFWNGAKSIIVDGVGCASRLSHISNQQFLLVNQSKYPVPKIICNSHFDNGDHNGSISIFKWGKIMIIIVVGVRIASSLSHISNQQLLLVYQSKYPVPKVICNSHFDNGVCNGSISNLKWGKIMIIIVVGIRCASRLSHISNQQFLY